MAKIQNTKFNANAWAKHEAATAKDEFCEIRLARRLRQLLKQITMAGESSIPFVCQDAAQSKAAYRFFQIHALMNGLFYRDICIAQVSVSD